MTHITHAWAAMAALGAGLVHLAVAAGSSPVLLVAFALIGALQIVWAALSLGRSRYVLARAYPALALLPLAAWAAGVLAGADAAALPPLSLAIAAILGFVSTGFVVVASRRGTDRETTREPSPGRLTLGFLIGAFVMAGIALPALGQTAAGIAASQGPHAHHAISDVPDEHDSGH